MSTPAQQALQENLESTLTLGKKRSWYYGARDFVHRSALNAKGYVDSLRGDHTKANNLTNIPATASDGRSDEAQLMHGGSQDSQDPSVPLVGPRTKTSWNHTVNITPKSAKASVRSLHSSERHRRHKSLPKIISFVRPSSSLAWARGPDHFAELDEQETRDGYRSRGRGSSFANSLVESISGLKRRSTVTSKLLSPKEIVVDSPTSDEHLTQLPLPSSPIDIPSKPPSLGLVDLGPVALLPTDFGCGRPIGETLERTLSDITTLHLDADPDLSFEPVAGPMTPGELLRLPSDDFGFNISDIDYVGDLDGNQSDTASQLFERSVESSPEHGKLQHGMLRSMSSLDALTEACAHDDEHHETLVPDGDTSFPLTQTSCKTSNSVQNTLPFDHDDTGHDRAAAQFAHWTQESTTVIRPKILVQSSSTESAHPHCTAKNDSMLQMASKFVQYPSPMPAFFRPTLDKAAAKHLGIFRLGSCPSLRTKYSADLRGSAFPSAESEASHCHGSAHDKICHSRAKSKIGSDPSSVCKAVAAVAPSRDASDETCVLDPGEYGHFKTAFIFGDLSQPLKPSVYYDEHDSEVRSTRPATAHAQYRFAQPNLPRLPLSEAPSAEIESTCAATDVLHAGWHAPAQYHEPEDLDQNTLSGHKRTLSSTPDLTSDISLISTKVVPSRSSPERVPSMGSRTSFERKRFDRAMRYDALFHRSTLPSGSALDQTSCISPSIRSRDGLSPPSAIPSPLRPRLHIRHGTCTDGSIDNPHDASHGTAAESELTDAVAAEIFVRDVAIERAHDD